MSELEMQRLIALLEKNLGANWRDVVAWMLEQNTVGDIEARLVSGDIAGLLADVESGAKMFAANVHTAYVTAGQTTAARLDAKIADKLVHFDASASNAVNAARQNQYELVQGLVEEQRTTIRSVISDGVGRGIAPREMARDIRSSIGLTPNQSDAVLSYRRALESGDYSNALGRELRDGRSDRTLRAAGRDGTALDAAKVDDLTERYRVNFVNHRAEVVARTEALRAAHEGSAESIRQAVSRGDVDADQLETTWHAGPKKKHSRMNHQHLNDKTIKYGETFDMGDGTRMRYPGDPAGGAKNTAQCACAASTTITGL